MKKNKLKSGMIVEYRNGAKRLIVGDKLIGDNGYTSLSNFNDDLKHTMPSDFDIIKIYNYIYARNFSELLEDANLDLIWERKEIEVSDREIEILKALKILGYKFLARDENNGLYAYGKKPFILSLSNYWVTCDDVYAKVNSDAFTFIKWEDKEPTKINSLLENE